MRKLQNPWVHLPGYNCFGCSPSNEQGVHMEFYENGDEVVSFWKPQQQFQGWHNTLHGGVQAVLLDEICAWAVVRMLNVAGVTSKMETRYRKPVSTVDGFLVLRAHIVQQRRSIVEISATLHNADGELCTEATCTFFTFKNGDSENMPFRPCEAIGEDLTFEQIVAMMKK